MGKTSESPNRTVTERGFIGYDQLTDAYGAEVRVYESSAAKGPHVWLRTEGGANGQGAAAAHLDEQQARRVVAALQTFLDEIPERWVS